MFLFFWVIFVTWSSWSSRCHCSSGLGRQDEWESKQTAPGQRVGDKPVRDGLCEEGQEGAEAGGARAGEIRTNLTVS